MKKKHGSRKINIKALTLTALALIGLYIAGTKANKGTKAIQYQNPNQNSTKFEEEMVVKSSHRPLHRPAPRPRSSGFAAMGCEQIKTKMKELQRKRPTADNRNRWNKQMREIKKEYMGCIKMGRHPSIKRGTGRRPMMRPRS